MLLNPLMQFRENSRKLFRKFAIKQQVGLLSTAVKNLIKFSILKSKLKYDKNNTDDLLFYSQCVV